MMCETVKEPLSITVEMDLSRTGHNHKQQPSQGSPRQKESRILKHKKPQNNIVYITCLKYKSDKPLVIGSIILKKDILLSKKFLINSYVV